MTKIHMLKIFFIIVSYKDTSEIIRLLGSIKNQTNNKNKFEVESIVVDNAYIEENKKLILKKFPKTTYLGMNVNVGFAKAVNKGIRLAIHKKADFVCLLNPDVKISADFTAELLKRKIEIAGPIISYQKNGKTI